MSFKLAPEVFIVSCAMEHSFLSVNVLYMSVSSLFVLCCFYDLILWQITIYPLDDNWYLLDLCYAVVYISIELLSFPFSHAYCYNMVVNFSAIIWVYLCWFSADVSWVVSWWPSDWLCCYELCLTWHFHCSLQHCHFQMKPGIGEKLRNDKMVRESRGLVLKSRSYENV